MNKLIFGSEAFSYVFIALLIVLSAFFSGSEIAFAGLNKRRLKKQADEGSKSSRLSLKLCENYEDILPAILVGNNLVNIAASSVATVIALRLFRNSGAGTTVAAAVMTVLILIFGEIIPKLLANEHNIAFSKAVSYPLQIVIYVFTPFVFVITKIVELISHLWGKSEESKSITEDELLTIIETVEDEGVIDEEKSELLQSAIEFDEITVREVLTPRVDMFAIDIDEDKNDTINSLLECQFSRIPVYKDTIDNIIGIVYLTEILKALLDKNQNEIDLYDFLHEPIFFPQSAKLDTVLEEFRQKQLHMAIVTDEYGGTMGLLTLEDVVEEIVGDIWDEKDVITNEAVQIGEDLYEINGDMAISDFCDMFDLSEDSLDCDCITIGGLAIEKLNGYPNVGDEFEIGNILFNIRSTDEKRVKKLNVKILHDSTKKDEN